MKKILYNSHLSNLQGMSVWWVVSLESEIRAFINDHQPLPIVLHLWPLSASSIHTCVFVAYLCFPLWFQRPVRSPPAVNQQWKPVNKLWPFCRCLLSVCFCHSLNSVSERQIHHSKVQQHTVYSPGRPRSSCVYVFVHIWVCMWARVRMGKKVCERVCMCVTRKSERYKVTKFEKQMILFSHVR